MTTVAEHENRLKRMNRFNATGKRKVEESQKRVRRKPSLDGQERK